MAARKARTKDELIESIKSRILEDGDCMVWQGAAYQGSPIVKMKVDGKWITAKVRRLLYDETRKVRSGHTHYVNTCGNPLCVNPDHTKVLTSKQNMARANAAVSKTKRQIAGKEFVKMNSKITQEIADAIRLSDKSKLELSQEYGIAVRTIEDVLNFKTWNSRNIFSGLFG